MDNGYTGYRVLDTTKHPGSRSAARCDGNTGSGFEIIVKFPLYFSTLNMRHCNLNKKQESGSDLFQNPAEIQI